MTESEQLDQALTEADARKWRYKAEQAEAALARSETHLKLMQAEIDKIARNLGKEIELLARAEQAEATLATMKAERDYWEARCKRAEDEALAQVQP